MTAALKTWKVTVPIRDQNGRRGEFVGEVDAPSEAAAEQAVAEMLQRDSHQTRGPIKLRPR